MLVEHRQLTHLIADLQAGYGLRIGDRVLQFSAIGFDVAVQEILGSLCCGGTVVLRSGRWLGSARRFWRSRPTSGNGRRRWRDLDRRRWGQPRLLEPARNDGCKICAGSIWHCPGCAYVPNRRSGTLASRRYGFRVELEEIEARLCMLRGVVAAAVVVREDGTGDKRLLAYVVTADTSIDVHQLREAARQTLPGYIMPTSIIRLDALPRTVNGKIDHGMLQAT